MANRGGHVRFLVAGYGLIGQRHVRHILEHEQFQLAGVIEPTEHVPSDLPQWPNFNDVDVPADGIVIATPTSTHKPVALTAIKRGLPCLIEKPITNTLASAEILTAMSEQEGVPILVGHHRRYHASVKRLKATIDTGDLGTIVAANMMWHLRKPDEYFQGNWRDGAEGSPVTINLTHDLDLLRYLFGDVGEITGLSSKAQRNAGRIESGGVILRHKSGTLTTLSFADTTPSPWGFEAGTRENPNIAGSGQDMLFVMGTKGAISFPSLTCWSGSLSWNDPQSAEILSTDRSTPLIAQLEHFAAVIKGAPPLITAREGMETLRLTLRVQEVLTEHAEPA